MMKTLKDMERGGRDVHRKQSLRRTSSGLLLEHVDRIFVFHFQLKTKFGRQMRGSLQSEWAANIHPSISIVYPS